MVRKRSYEELEKYARGLEAECNRLATVEAELKRSLRFTESLLMAIPTPVFFKDEKGRYQGCNPAFTEMMGVTSEELKGKTVHELWPGEQAEVYHQMDLQLMGNRGRQIYEFEVTDKNGITRPVVFYKSVYHDEHGKVAGLVGGFVDLTERRRAEGELLVFFAMSLDMLCIADINTASFVKVSPSFTETLGYTEEELLGRPFTEFIHPEDVERTLAVVEECLKRGEKVFNFRNRYRLKSGEYRWLNWVSHPLPEKGLTYAVAHDITDEIQAGEALRSQRDLLNSLFDNLLLGVTVWDAEGRLLMMNKGFIELTGYTEEDIQNLDDWFPRAYPDPEYRSTVVADWEAVRGSKEAVREFRIVCKTGSVKEMEFRATFLRDGRALVTLADITDRKRAREELEASHHLLRSILDAVPDLLFVVDRDFNILFSNDKVLNCHQTASGNGGNRCHSRFPSLVGPCEDCNAKVVFESGESVEREMLNPADGRVQEVRAFPIRNTAGEVVQVVEHVRDLTELVRTREESLRRQQFLESLLYHAPDAIVTLDPEHRVIGWNPGAVRMFGYETEEAMGQQLDDLVARGEHHVEAGAKTRQVLSGRRVEAFETVRYKKDGTPLRVIAAGSPIMQNGVLTGVVAVYTDITERVRAETALRESEERFRTLVEESPLGIALMATDGRFLYTSPRFLKMFGYTMEEIPTRHDWFQATFPGESQRDKGYDLWITELDQALEGQALSRMFVATCKDGSQKDIHLRLVRMANADQLVICEDITEKTKLERQFQQAQKFEAIGTLAGGIAHDFNNLLMGIQGRASLILADLPASHPHVEHLRAMEDHVRSASDLTRQLLGFARGGKYEVKPTDVNGLLVETADMFGRTRKEIRIHKKTSPRPLTAEVDRRQIEHVLLNLFVNAWQAMPGGGDLYLETDAISLDNNGALPYEVPPGSYARISVIDTGIGMDEETRQRIFDPFFTTKEMGRGTGLGLASAYGIIKNHGGFITVYSEVDHGTVFRIHLPLTQKEPGREISVEGRLQKGTETVLLVDDEAMILSVGRAMLEKLGYRVIVAGSGEEALQILSEKGAEIDLVVLDLIMPGMSGSQAFDRIREMLPGMRVLLSSGYAVNGQAQEALNKGCDGFIQKPFDLIQLAEKLRTVLK
ncbi:MAG: PAS domain S-box protein [Deltaproteobacteria bacterium]|nr:PAS domain S-box protein [Deltaproteobacteria bacterium]